ncbi:hypothetical protein [Anatilimnocola floriformis]|uniref:hypothetical protein n=1 Tax=Anatilimnocola floriformis TaxID=2948575 RepID=UPI0020C24523|nr:hypothetical protein [Anatilimnocola floriformis]
MIAFLVCMLTPMPPAHPDSEFSTDTAAQYEKKIQSLTTAISKMTAVKLLEGLPHQLYETESLEQELKDKKTVKIHGFPFYDGRIDVDNKVTKQLREVWSDPKHFARFDTPAACGGFHPDWCVEFTQNQTVYQVLICFGCHEARLYGPISSAYVVLGDESYKELVAVLKPFQKQRPKFKASKSLSPTE